ncbi:MAG: hypothetical protein MUC96_09085 [Myxococcaceae bacterium]|jgi:uncharacterized membrane protein|nr:hypothetical protein [Myxococcaceae bacterium]
MTRALTGVVAVVMLAGGAAHFLQADQFVPLVPSFLPAGPVIAVTGVLQLAIGFAALWPGTRRLAGLAFAALCLAYLPLHLWDFVRPDPMFAPVGAALVRVVVQLLFIGAGWQLARRTALPARSS